MPHRSRHCSAAADEHRVRPRQVPQRGRGGALDDRQVGHAEVGGVAGDPADARGVALDGDGAVGRVGQHPLDADRAGAGADIPQQLAATGRQGRERDGADVLLGQLAVMLEPGVGQARGQRDDAGAGRGGQFQRDEVQRVDVRRARTRRRWWCVRRSRGPPRASQTVMRGVAEAVADQKIGQLAGGVSRPRTG